MKLRRQLPFAAALALGLAAPSLLHAAAPTADQPAAQLEAQPDGQGGTSSHVKDQLFAGTEKFSKDASDVTEINQDWSSMGMVTGQKSNRAKHTVLNVVRTYSYDKPGMYNIKDVEEFRQRLDTGDWHCSVHTRDFKHGESTDICEKDRNDGLVEKAIITVEPKELTFIHTITRPYTDADKGSQDHALRLQLGPMGTLGSNGTYTIHLDALNGVMNGQLAQLSMLDGATMPLMEARMAAAEARMEIDRARNEARMQEWQELAPYRLNSIIVKAPAPPTPPSAPKAPAPPSAPQF